MQWLGTLVAHETQFCMPDGLRIKARREAPKFFTFVLTDAVGAHLYCSCLVFDEVLCLCSSCCSSSPLCSQGVNATTKRYVPKCMCVVSRLAFHDVFKRYLTSLYSAYLHTARLCSQLSTLHQQQQEWCYSYTSSLLASFLSNLLLETLLPPPGQVALALTLPSPPSTLLPSLSLPPPSSSPLPLSSSLSASSPIVVEVDKGETEETYEKTEKEANEDKKTGNEASIKKEEKEQNEENEENKEKEEKASKAAKEEQKEAKDDDEEKEEEEGKRDQEEEGVLLFQQQQFVDEGLNDKLEEEKDRSAEQGKNDFWIDHKENEEQEEENLACTQTQEGTEKEKKLKVENEVSEAMTDTKQGVIHLFRPALNGFPLLDFSLRAMFSALDAGNVVDLLLAALLEKKVLLYSRQNALLSQVAEGLSALMYPFRWSRVYIPILAKKLLTCAEAPTPFIMGMNAAYLDALPPLQEVVLVDLDNNRIKSSEGLAASITDGVDFPAGPKAKLLDTLREILHPELADIDLAFPNNKSRACIDWQHCEQRIRIAFLLFFARLFGNYAAYITGYSPSSTSPIGDSIIFDETAYLNDQPDSSQEFYETFFMTEVWMAFIQERKHGANDLFEDLLNFKRQKQRERSASREGPITKGRRKGLRDETSANYLPTTPPLQLSLSRHTEEYTFLQPGQIDGAVTFLLSRFCKPSSVLTLPRPRLPSFTCSSLSSTPRAEVLCRKVSPESDTIMTTATAAITTTTSVSATEDSPLPPPQYLKPIYAQQRQQTQSHQHNGKEISSSSPTIGCFDGFPTLSVESFMTIGARYEDMVSSLTTCIEERAEVAQYYLLRARLLEEVGGIKQLEQALHDYNNVWGLMYGYHSITDYTRERVAGILTRMPKRALEVAMQQHSIGSYVHSLLATQLAEEERKNLEADDDYMHTGATTRSSSAPNSPPSRTSTPVHTIHPPAHKQLSHPDYDDDDDDDDDYPTNTNYNRRDINHSGSQLSNTRTPRGSSCTDTDAIIIDAKTPQTELGDWSYCLSLRNLALWMPTNEKRVGWKAFHRYVSLTNVVTSKEEAKVIYSLLGDRKKGVEKGILLNKLSKFVHLLQATYRKLSSRRLRKDIRSLDDGEFVLHMSSGNVTTASVVKGALILTNRRVLFAGRKADSPSVITTLDQLTQVERYNFKVYIPPGLPCIRIYTQSKRKGETFCFGPPSIWSQRDVWVAYLTEMQVAWEIARDLCDPRFISRAAHRIVLSEVLHKLEKKHLMVLRHQNFVNENYYRIAKKLESLGIVNGLYQSITETPTENGCLLAEQLLGSIVSLFFAHVQPDGKSVDWEAMRASQEFRKFEIACADLRKVDLSRLSDTERKAFFINVYNVLAIHGYVVVGFPSSSLDWRYYSRTACYDIGGLPFSLDEIQHGILRANRPFPWFCKPLFGEEDPRLPFMIADVDSRVHFALAVHSEFSPCLRLYVADHIDAQLTTATEEYLTSCVHTKPKRKQIVLPELFRCYKSDFVENEEDDVTLLTRHVLPYLAGNLQKAVNSLLQEGCGFHIRYSSPGWAFSPKPFRQM
ncbi:DENN (AEX3) domain containing protein, variant 2 [Balamuthia mandrillaris]